MNFYQRKKKHFVCVLINAFRHTLIFVDLVFIWTRRGSISLSNSKNIWKTIKIKIHNKVIMKTSFYKQNNIFKFRHFF